MIELTISWLELDTCQLSLRYVCLAKLDSYGNCYSFGKCIRGSTRGAFIYLDLFFSFFFFESDSEFVTGNI